MEVRALTSTTMLAGYLDRPDCCQVFRLVRERRGGGKVEVEVVYGITSLTRGQADAARLLELVRGHWEIENRLFRVKDETLGEDKCRVRKGHGPAVMAVLRNVAVQLLDEAQRREGRMTKAALTRRFAARPAEALAIFSTTDL